MKVSMIIVCLAIVPFVVAQAAPATEEVDGEAWDWDWTFGGWFETDPVVTFKEKAQQALDNMNGAHRQINDLIEDWALPAIPGEEDYLTIQEIQAKIDELSATLEQRIQLEIDGLQSVFIEDSDPEAESEPHVNAEPEAAAEPISLAEKFLAWFN